jgi:hypothetical protein
MRVSLEAITARLSCQQTSGALRNWSTVLLPSSVSSFTPHNFKDLSAFSCFYNSSLTLVNFSDVSDAPIAKSLSIPDYLASQPIHHANLCRRCIYNYRGG